MDNGQVVGRLQVHAPLRPPLPSYLCNQTSSRDQPKARFGGTTEIHLEERKIICMAQSCIMGTNEAILLLCSMQIRNIDESVEYSY